MKYNLFVQLALLTLTCGLITSCGSDQEYEQYKLQDLSSIVLGPNNHPHGYGQTLCFNCHNKANIHQVDRLNSGQLPTARALVEASGLAACRGCHGTNGVTP